VIEPPTSDGATESHPRRRRAGFAANLPPATPTTALAPRAAGGQRETQPRLRRTARASRDQEQVAGQGTASSPAGGRRTVRPAGAFAERRGSRGAKPRGRCAAAPKLFGGTPPPTERRSATEEAAPRQGSSPTALRAGSVQPPGGTERVSNRGRRSSGARTKEAAVDRRARITTSSRACRCLKAPSLQRALAVRPRCFCLLAATPSSCDPVAGDGGPNADRTRWAGGGESVKLG